MKPPATRLRHKTPRRKPEVRRRPGALSQSGSYFMRHAQTLIYTLGQLLRTPFATLMTTAVIGIALALPTGLHVLLKNAELLSGEIDGATQVSLFLKHTVNETEARKLQNRLQELPEISKVQFISKQAALEEFKQHTGFGEAIDSLGENPLPHVIVIHPALQQTDEQAMQQLLLRLRDMPQVDVAQLDEEWIQRLYSIMDFLRRGVWILAAMLALAVLLVVGNTIRLAIQNRRDEIVIIKLIGGTDAFIRRPFLYTGFWYGLAGALFAFVLIHGALFLLGGPLEQLARLYHTEISLSSLTAGSGLLLFGTGISLGLIGSWLAVGRHLRDIEPR